jgi:hypothetical protein
MFAPRDHDFPRRPDTIPRHKSRKARLRRKRPDPPCSGTTGRDLPRRNGLRVRHDLLTPRPRNHRRTADQRWGGYSVPRRPGDR